MYKALLRMQHELTDTMFITLSENVINPCQVSRCSGDCA